MRNVLAVVLCLAMPIAMLAQSGAVIPQGGAGHADKASCVILKRMGPADQVTSRLYSFGIRGKQFQYVEGKLPDGFPFHGRLTDHDVRNLQGRGAEVIVVQQNYTAEELKQARVDCLQQTGKSPNQAQTAEAAAPAASQPAAQAPEQQESPKAASAQLSLTSDPMGADIEVDGNFVGDTPSSLEVAIGSHQITIKKSGFKPWERKMMISGGQVSINAGLEPEGK